MYVSSLSTKSDPGNRSICCHRESGTHSSKTNLFVTLILKSGFSNKCHLKGYLLVIAKMDFK